VDLPTSWQEKNMERDVLPRINATYMSNRRDSTVKIEDTTSIFL
jgi:hypothetical protein